MLTSFLALYYVDDTWYSFATYNGKDYKGGKSSKLDSGWKTFDGPILDMSTAKWSAKDGSVKYGLWAPDVFQRPGDGKFVMFVLDHSRAQP